MKKAIYLFSLIFLFLTSYSCNEQDEIDSLEMTNLKSSTEKDMSLASDEGCETAFAYCDKLSTCFLDLDLDNDNVPDFNRWGWTNGPVQPESHRWFYMYAAAGQCDPNKGIEVGKVHVWYYGSTATVSYQMYEGYTLNEVQFYIGNDILPSKKGKYTVASGQYPYKNDTLNGTTSHTFTVENLFGEIYFIAHAVVCGF